MVARFTQMESYHQPYKKDKAELLCSQAEEAKKWTFLWPEKKLHTLKIK